MSTIACVIPGSEEPRDVGGDLRTQIPCGVATVKVEEAIGVDIAPVSEEFAITDILGKVTSGQADAGLVYVTDASGSGDKVVTIAVPEFAEAVNTYPIALLTDSASRSPCPPADRGTRACARGPCRRRRSPPPKCRYPSMTCSGDPRLQPPTGDEVVRPGILGHVGGVLVAHVDHAGADLDDARLDADGRKAWERRRELIGEVVHTR